MTVAGRTDTSAEAKPCYRRIVADTVAVVEIAVEEEFVGSWVHWDRLPFAQASDIGSGQHGSSKKDSLRFSRDVGVEGHSSETC